MLAFVLPTCALDLTDPGTLSTTFDHIRPVLSSIAGDDYPLLQTGQNFVTRTQSFQK